MHISLGFTGKDITKSPFYLVDNLRFYLCILVLWANNLWPADH